MEPSNRKDRGASPSKNAVLHSWKKVGSGLSLCKSKLVGGGGKGGSRSCISGGSLWSSSDSSSKNYLAMHLWPACHLSSQLKQRPLARLACISVGEKCLMGKGVD